MHRSASEMLSHRRGVHDDRLVANGGPQPGLAMWPRGWPGGLRLLPRRNGAQILRRRSRGNDRCGGLASFWPARRARQPDRSGSGPVAGWRGAAGGITGALGATVLLSALGVTAGIIFWPATLAVAMLAGIGAGSYQLKETRCDRQAARPPPLCAGPPTRS